MRKVFGLASTLFLLSLLAGCASTELIPSEIEYKEITADEYQNTSSASRTDWFSSQKGYKISDVTIFYPTITTENGAEEVVFEIRGQRIVYATDYIKRTNQTAQDFKKRLDSLYNNNKYNGHYTIYVYGIQEWGHSILGYNSKTKVILYDIEGIPSQEQLDAEAAAEEKERAEKAAAEEKARAEKNARMNARGKEIAKGYVYHGIDENSKSRNLFSNGALESGHAYCISGFVVKYGGSMAAIENGDGLFFSFQSSAVYVDYISQKVKGEVVSASVTSILGQKLEIPVTVVVAGGSGITKTPVVLGLVETE